ncbi:hypothetical protein [Streptomyces griseoaurantiacus]|uniref:hypothetical protein n=1 Tax=Streptomyces griseoaurantiacus TaxID=68213 RepID=UPI0036760D74
MATATIPPHVDTVRRNAHDMGCEVINSATSVRIKPPAVMQVKPFGISLNPAPTQPQLTNLLKKNGFHSAWQRWERENGEKKEQEPKGKKKDFPCPECAEGGSPRSFTTPQGLGAHRYRAHRVEGSSPDSLRKKAAGGSAKAPQEKQEPEKASAVAPEQSMEPSPAVQAVSAPAAELPTRVAAAVAALVHAVGSETGDAASLREENARLRDFRGKVHAQASDGTQAPVQAVANILALCRDATA